MFHIELKDFPNVARAFNLNRETLEARFVRPWVVGDLIQYNDRRWAPDRTTLTVLSGPEIDDAARGLGRGWGEVTRHSENVTDAVVADVRQGTQTQPEVGALSRAVAEVAAGAQDGISFSDTVALAGAAHPGWRASQQLAIAEQTVWEMLHRRRLELVDADGTPVAAERWQEIVLSWGTWASEVVVRLRAPGPAPG